MCACVCTHIVNPTTTTRATKPGEGSFLLGDPGLLNICLGIDFLTKYFCPLMGYFPVNDT